MLVSKRITNLDIKYTQIEHKQLISGIDWSSQTIHVTMLQLMYIMFDIQLKRINLISWSGRPVGVETEIILNVASCNQFFCVRNLLRVCVKYSIKIQFQTCINGYYFVLFFPSFSTSLPIFY